MLWGLIVLLIVAALVLQLLIAWGVLRQLRRPQRRSAGYALAMGEPTSPEEAGYETEELSVELDGRPPADLWLVTGRRPDGPVMLLVHGWGDSRTSVLRWLPQLAPHASTIVLFDLRGHGDSPVATSTWGSGDRDDVIRIARTLHERWLERKLVLIGISMGGSVAIDVGREAPVDAIIVDSPCLDPQDAVYRTLRKHRLPAWLTTRIVFAWLHRRDPELSDGDAAEHARGLTVPLLVIHGDADVIVPVDHARTIADAASAGRLVVFQDAIHLGACDRDPDKYGATVSQFLKEHVISR